MIAFGLGHIRNPAEQVQRSFRLVGASAAPSTPPMWSLKGAAAPVMNQDMTNSCVGHAVSGAIYTALATTGTPLSFVPDPGALYTLARCIDRRSPDEPLADGGTMPAAAMLALGEWGVVPREAGIDLAHVNDEPTLASLEGGAAHHLVGEYQIGSWGRERIDDVRRSLVAGWPVCLATYVDTAFERYSGGVLSAPIMRDVHGSHFVYAIAYREDGAQTVFTIRNSWGVSWGQDGDVDVDESHVGMWSDVHCMAVRRRA